MGKTRGVHETTPELRNRMVGMYEAGLGLRGIAAAVNCSQRTVKRWLNRFNKEGTVETRERCGRKRATTAEQDEAIVRLATQTPIRTAKAVLPALGLTCSVDTIRERLHKAGIHNWSPSRKYMQRIPLGETDGVAIQQTVWRPTGTQLGKKKSSKDSKKNDKNVATIKKKHSSRKIKTEDVHVGDGAPLENVKHPNEQDFMYHQQNAQQSQVNEIQTTSQPLSQSQTEFGNTLTLTQQMQSAFQHSSLNVSQNWPLDLVQGSNHYPEGQTSSIPHEQSSLQHNLHAEQEQQQQHIRVQQKQPTITNQTHNFDQQQRHVRSNVQQQHRYEHLNSQLTSSQPSTTLGSDNTNSCGSQDNNQSSSGEFNQCKDSLKLSSEQSGQQKRKKKGGKAKGTLETSVEIRNRMIGMSEAGLSTLSIALAIDRSERTVKRWLERWHKEGNVQTKERKGRRRITTKEQDEAIVAMVTQQPLTPAKHVAPALGLKCSVDTIRERLHKAGIHSWKLGKKQGEGNAVHTVHLWQPSGNRPNKPKITGEKKKKAGSNKKRDQLQKRPLTRKRKTESNSTKIVPSTTNILPEQSTALPFHNPGTGSTIMQSVHNIPIPPPPPILQTQPDPPTGLPPQASQSMQPMDSMMQQRSDCRLASTIVPPVSAQGNSGVAYPSCMVGNNNHAGHMEQSDPLNYEPYIWSF